MKNNNLILSFKYAFEGIFSSFKSERNMKIHVLMMVLVCLMGVVFKISRVEWIMCVLCFVSVIGAEMFNTAIETVVDIASPEIQNSAKLAKDISAGAVLVFAIGSVVIGAIIFLPKILSLFH